MIIQNGTIRLKMKTGGGIDPETGYATSPGFEWGDSIPCQFYANTYNLQARTKNNDPYTAQSYTILVDLQPIGDHEQVLLTEGCDCECGREIGEFSIRQAEPLRAVGQLRITV